MKNSDNQKPIIFILFGATGNLAVKKIFPALETLYNEGKFPVGSRIIAVSRRDWNDAEFIEYLKESVENRPSVDFLKLFSYSKVDIDHETGYKELDEKLEHLKKEVKGAKEILYFSLAPRHQSHIFKELINSKVLVRGGAKLLIEKPFGTDEKSAKALDQLLLSSINEKQIYRIDHYLGKDTVRAIMDLHEKTPDFSLMLSGENVELIKIALFEKKGIESRGASYDDVGAFRDVGQNHMLEMLAVLAADVPKKSWQTARTDVLKHLSPPSHTCEMSRRGQYEDYKNEKGVNQESKTETAFEVVTNLSNGKLAHVPLILQSGKKMPKSEVFIEINFKEIEGLPKMMRFSVQLEQEIITEYRDGTRDIFEVPKVNEAYTNIIRAAMDGSFREFVGSDEIESLWRYADRIVDCWNKVPLEIYSDDKPFLID